MTLGEVKSFTNRYLGRKLSTQTVVWYVARVGAIYESVMVIPYFEKAHVHIRITAPHSSHDELKKCDIFR